MAEPRPILEVIRSRQTFSGPRGGLFGRRQGTGVRRRRTIVLRLAWRDAWDGWGIGVRQVDGGPHDRQADRTDLGHHSPRRPGHHGAAAAGRCGRIARSSNSFSRIPTPRSIRAWPAGGEIVAEPLHNYPQALRPDARGARDAAPCPGRTAAGAHARNIHTSSRAVSASGSASPARLALDPRLIVADEPVSRARRARCRRKSINLMADLQSEFGLSYLFIAHDLAVVQHISQRVAVMYLGRIVELGCHARPLHLARSIPTPRRCSTPCRSLDPDRQRPAEVLTRRRAKPDAPAARLPLSHALPLCGRTLPHRGTANARGDDRHTSPPVTCVHLPARHARRLAHPTRRASMPATVIKKRRLGDRLAGPARPPRLHARRRCRVRRQHHHPRWQGLRRPGRQDRRWTPSAW